MSKTDSTASIWGRDYIAAKTIVSIFKLMGLAPFIVRKSANRKLRITSAWQNIPTMQFSTSVCGCIYNLCLIASQVCLLVLTVPTSMSDDPVPMTPINKGIDVVACAIGYFTTFFIWLIFAFRQESIVSLLNQLSSYNGTILCIKDGQLPKTTRYFAVRVCLTNIFMAVALVYGDYLAYGSVPKTYVMYIVPTTITTWFLSHYAFTVKMTENRYKAINQSLLRCCLPAPTALPQASDGERIFFGTNTSAQNIASLRRAHSNLGAISSDLSSFYSVPTLFSIAYYCYLLIVCAYHISQRIVTHADSNVFTLIFSVLIWMSMTFIAIAALTTGVTNVVKESKKTCDVVKKLLTHSDNSQEAKAELEDFLLQLLHQDIRYTACGLFPLDSTLLHSLFGGVIAYIVILIQIQSLKFI